MDLRVFVCPPLLAIVNCDVASADFIVGYRKSTFDHGVCLETNARRKDRKENNSELDTKGYNF